MLTYDATVRIWRADGNAEPLVLKGHSSSVIAAAFSPDGAHIITGSYDCTARIWCIKPEPLMALLRQVTTACLTPRQRERYLGETPEEALAGFLQCERRHGRKPLGY
jgi:WD40 repeat protein